MIIINRISKALLAVMLTVGAFAAQAETLSGQTATVTVQNTFTFANTAALNFGTLRATGSSGASASYTVFADGSNGTTAAASPAIASLTELVAGTPATFTVTGAAPFTTLTITAPTTTTNITGTGPGTASAFLIDPGFGTTSGWNAELTSGNVVGAYNSASPNMQTDASGAAGFSLGAVLETKLTGVTSGFVEGAHSGTYSIQVNY